MCCHLLIVLYLFGLRSSWFLVWQVIFHMKSRYFCIVILFSLNWVAFKNPFWQGKEEGWGCHLITALPLPSGFNLHQFLAVSKGDTLGEAPGCQHGLGAPCWQHGLGGLINAGWCWKSWLSTRPLLTLHQRRGTGARSLPGRNSGSPPGFHWHCRETSLQVSGNNTPSSLLDFFLF